MKTYFTLLIALTLAASLPAAPKNAAKPTKPVATEPPAAAAVPTPQPTPKTEGGLVMSLAFYGAYNIASSDLFTLPAGSTASWTTSGGGVLGAGANFMIGSQLIRGGVNVAYSPIGEYRQGGSTVFLRYLPIEGLLRLYPIAGLYVGGLAGYALDLSSAVVSGSGSLTKTDGITYGGSLGYLIKNGPVDLDLGVDIRMLSLSATAPTGGSNFSLTSLDATSVAAGVSKTYTILNIVPRVGFNYKF